MTLARLVAALRERGRRVVVARPRQAHEDGCRAVEDELVLPGAPLPFYPTLRVGLPSLSALRAAWRRRRPDVVHVATEGFLGQSAVRAALDLNLPVTSSYHTHFDDFARHYGAWWLVPTIRAHMRAFHNRTQRTIVPSPDVRDRLRRAGIRNCRVMGRGIDTSHFHPARRREATRASWGVARDDLVLINVGRLAPEKNFELLLSSFRAVRARHPRARLVLVGDGPLREALGDADGVVVVGAKPHAEVGRHLAAADLFVFPSCTETFGNVLCEAMACGLATVSFDYAASATWVRHGVNGVKAPFGDEGAFRRQVLEAAADAELRTRLGDEAHRSMKAMDWDRVVDRFEAIVRSAVARRARRARRSLGRRA